MRKLGLQAQQQVGLGFVISAVCHLNLATLKSLADTCRYHQPSSSFDDVVVQVQPIWHIS
jgi:hypothetical protein